MGAVKMKLGRDPGRDFARVRAARQPVLAITGHTFHDLIGTHYRQDVDLDKLFMNVAAYDQRVMGPAHLPNVVDEAVKTALTRHTVTHITIPKDIQEWTVKEGERSGANIALHSSDLFAAVSSLHPLGGCGDILVKGCTKLGIPVCIGGLVAIIAGSHDERPHCIDRGFCIQGCKVGAKQSTLVSHVPDALTCGAEIRAECMASRVSLGRDGRVTGVTYFDPAGRECEQKAKAVIVCGYAIETPRPLLNSACPGFEQGLANSSGTLGRYLMAQAGNVVLGRFDQLVRMYKAPPAHALTEEFYETDAKRGFARGFAVQTVGPLPIAFAQQIAVAKGAWGWGMREAIMDYNHWGAIALLGELLPWEDNRVEIAGEKDAHGIPVAKVTFNLHDNDHKLIAFGQNKVVDIMRAAGAGEVVQEARYAHLVGGARMRSDPRTSVVDRFGRSHDFANLFICDGSVMPTQGSANPGLTIQALAARTADFLIAQGSAIFSSSVRGMETPPVRRDLSPPETRRHGVPRFA